MPSANIDPDPAVVSSAKVDADPSARLADWCERHALVVLACTALAVLFASAWWIVVPAAFSFAVLIRRRAEAGLRDRPFGSANQVTALRLAGTLVLPALVASGPLAVIVLASAVLALDGVDGWLARRRGLASEFGEYFDKEADALLMLLLSVLLLQSGRLGAWVLLPGVLRYAFVVFLMLARPPAPKERRSNFGRWIFVGTTGALIAAFSPFPRLYEPWLAGMTVLLVVSFARAVIDLYRGAPSEAGNPASNPATGPSSRLRTRIVRDRLDVVRFFDALAPTYRDLHDDAERALRRRLALIRRLLPPRPSLLVEIGCGNGLHLFALADAVDAALGVDASPAMIAAAEALRAGHERGDRIRLVVGYAERMPDVGSGSADVVLCVGAFEHMLEQAAVLAEAARVLRPGGAFVCLSPNGGALWYATLAPRLGFDTRHLSTDRFIAPDEWPALLRVAGLRPVEIGFWRFVPAGDMPRPLARAMRALDRIGAVLRIGALRGGCYVKAVKPGERAE